MFRRPRETAVDTHEDVKPSVGRPPTPPLTPAKTPFSLAVPPTIPPPKMAATKAKPTKPTPMPTIGRQGPAGSAKKTPAVKGVKDKANGNIMAFFKKSEAEGGLFVQERSGSRRDQGFGNENRAPSVEADDVGLYGTDGESRFNENAEPHKRRKTSPEPDHDTELFGEDAEAEVEAVDETSAVPQGEQVPSGPFFEESDSEQDEEQPEAVIGIGQQAGELEDEAELIAGTVPKQGEIDLEQTGERAPSPSLGKPPLIKEETSFEGNLEDFQDFEGMDDFDEDQFEEGDEFMERRYMEEQARLEAEQDEKDYGPTSPEVDSIPDQAMEDAPSCPICSASLKGVNEQDAGVHVNNCLDGNPTPLPEQEKPPPAPAIKTENAPSPGANQFKKPNRAPKPGQANPFDLGKSTKASGSAFTQLMSGHSEEAAWKTAAASEQAARGKPAYQRTCPFYKILPGLFICVDAFRYGAVEGCKAYFLSHFHSDHYIGLTSSWSHGPIYCSKVTANLVRQQLRVDPKYVVPLEFEETVDVPNTRGVKVTMIPANHCPGSSLYLFEKPVGKKTNGEPRLQRILHCGDFRACRQHIEHPLLMPNVQDAVSGKTKEQKIDVCYLDTTYLNPKYAFPSQENVIKACADMCVSLSKHTIDDSDGWEQMKRQRAGEGMVKFIRKESNFEIKEEPPDEDDIDGMKLATNPNASQQVFTTSTTPSAPAGRGRLLVIVGTYSIGKERICLGIAKALNSKIYAPPSKQRIVAALEDPELNERMTSDPRAAQVHMTPLFEIRADTLDDYLKDYFPHFTRAVGFRPSGWNYRPPNSRFTDSPTVQTVLHSENWKSAYSMKDLVPQRGSSSRASCFGVPYSEHSSFRELTMFCCALRIEKVIPTVNVGSAKSRERMKAWCERWAVERRKNGVFELPGDGSW